METSGPPPLGQPQIWLANRILGLPKALERRCTQGKKSAAEVPADVAHPNTTASGPYRALISTRREAVRAIASSQEMRTQPGSRSPLGRVRNMGYWRRSGE